MEINRFRRAKKLLTQQQSPGTSRADQILLLLMVLMPVVSAVVLALALGNLIFVCGPHWLAFLLGAVAFVATLAGLFAGLRDSTDLIVVSLMIIIGASFLFPVAAKARHILLHEQARLHQRR